MTEPPPPQPDRHQNPNWIPVSIPEPPKDWKAAQRRELKGPPGKSAGLEPLKNLTERVARLAANGGKGHIMAQAHQRMADCKPGAEACDKGWVDGLNDAGRPIPGARFPCDKKTMFCKHGRSEYVQECKMYLSGFGLAGKLAEACFLREADHPSMIDGGNPYIADDLSNEVYAWAVESGWRRNPLLILHGKAGPGKTHCALAALAHFKAALNRPGMFVNAVRLLRGNGTRDAVLEEVMRAEVLVIDDMGREVASEANKANLYMIIDARVSAYLPTIITTNLGFVDICNHYDDERLEDRLITFKSFETALPSKRTSS